MSPSPRTLIDKIWDSHAIGGGDPDFPAALYIDLHLLHEVTSPQAFDELEQRGIPLRRPDRTLATMDHSTPTDPAITRERLPMVDAAAAAQLERLEEGCAEHGVPLFGWGNSHRGIVHVMGPELGATQPGMTIVCGDSHTSTHGAFGALAFGIGTSEVAAVMATQCWLGRRPAGFEIHLSGSVSPGVTAKDLILATIASIGVDGGRGSVFEFTGAAVRAMSMEERMTLCNMSIEGGARAGLIAPDETTFAYLEGRPLAPAGDAWHAAVERWSRLPTDPGTHYPNRAEIDAGAVEPMITWGTHPGMGMAVTGEVPEPSGQEAEASRRALEYMAIEPGRPLLGHPIDVVFVGSCTNSRLSDLRAAARLLEGRRVASGVRMLVVPGSEQVKRAAEREGLAAIFDAAGAEWREAGCSMCLAMNGDRLEPGQYAVSTTNRNFEGRQGAGGRTFLASPMTAAASAVAGHVADARELL